MKWFFQNGFAPHETWEFLEIATWPFALSPFLDLNEIGLKKCFESTFGV